MVDRIARAARRYISQGYHVDDAIGKAIAENVRQGEPAWLYGRLAVKVFDRLTESL